MAVFEAAGGKADTRAVATRYRAGATAPVFYDPADPGRSVLAAGVDERCICLVRGIITLLLDGLAILTVALVAPLTLLRLPASYEPERGRTQA